MEQLEEEYEDELIDAFDSPARAASSPVKRSTIPCPRSGNSQSKMTTPLYPSFDDALEAPVAPAPTPAKPKLQDHEPVENQVLQSDALPFQLHQEQPLVHPTQEQELMASEALQQRQRQIEREMRVYQDRFGYVAQALAGETPRQIEERKKRQELRLDREEKRHAAMETRLQHQIERMHEREEMRARSHARHHRASRSLSPCGRHEEVDENDLTVDNNSQQRESH
ncbi:hypothetical protein PHYBOEH_008490 [Phytophthora boehmeriae]|uniref:Uncharacterized protein n=1 Tax=Phytophthora boehmeriae TaxID=109152 RepID=A0A8T1XE91_9STRA|nr:hypothetical protein PHYBOEH_008490 [Phytophthora boehmeriae]